MARDIEVLVEHHSAATGKAFAVLKVIAQEVTTMGSAEILNKLLQERTRFSPSSVYRAVKSLVRLGELTIEDQHQKQKGNRYQVEIQVLLNKPRRVTITPLAMTSEMVAALHDQRSMALNSSCQDDMSLMSGRHEAHVRVNTASCQGDMSLQLPPNKEHAHARVSGVFPKKEKEKEKAGQFFPQAEGEVLPVGWQPSDTEMAALEQTFPTLDLAKELKNFQRHNITKGKTSWNWHLSFEGWCETATKRHQEQQSSAKKNKQSSGTYVGSNGKGNGQPHTQNGGVVTPATPTTSPPADPPLHHFGEVDWKAQYAALPPEQQQAYREKAEAVIRAGVGDKYDWLWDEKTRARTLQANIQKLVEAEASV